MGNHQPVNGSGLQPESQQHTQQQQHQQQHGYPPGVRGGQVYNSNNTPPTGGNNNTAAVMYGGGVSSQQRGTSGGGGTPDYVSRPGGGGIGYGAQAGGGPPPPGSVGSGSAVTDESGRHQQQQQQQNMQRSTSDVSMTMMMDDSNNQHLHAGSSGAMQHQQQKEHGTSAASAVENFLDDDTVPTVFRWEHGGRQVYITGTFNGWSRQIPMHRSGNDFTYIHNLKRGKHAFKFIVDDEWRFAPDQPTIADIEGRINNFIDVTEFKAYTGDKEFEKEKAAAECGAVGGGVGVAVGDDMEGAGGDGNTDEVSGFGSNKPDRDGEVFSQNMPDVDDYTKEPPPLPPHLRHIILNKPPQLQDTAALPVPQHVALNHLYCTAIKDNMMVLGITQRFKTKFVTTVYYSPCSSS